MDKAKHILEVAQILRDDSAGNKQATMTDIDRAVHYLERYAKISDTDTEERINEIIKLKMERNIYRDKLKTLKGELERLVIRSDIN